MKFQAPPYSILTDPRTVSSFGPECVGLDIFLQRSGFVIVNNWSANLVCYIPLLLKDTYVLSQFFWMNGNAVNGNVDIGVYDEGGTKLVSAGSTVASGTSAIQIVNVADFTLPANKRMWLAIASDGTNRFVLSDLAANLGLGYIGVKQQASGWSSGLPSSASFATPTQALLPLCGFTGGVV